jgi:hypothetical protein
MTRSVPESLAPLLASLELDQTRIVTLRRLEALIVEAGVRTAPALVAHRLRERGWLLPTGLSGAWEFAPAAHAGPHGRGGLLIPVEAAFALRPGLPAAVALDAAVWAHGLSDRAPDRIVIALEPGATVPAGLRRQVHIVHFTARLDAVRLKAVPTQRLETLLVHLAARPRDLASWGGAPEWLGDVVAEADPEKVVAELERRPRSVRTRLAYLLSGTWPQLAARLGGGDSTIWLGPRRTSSRYSPEWRVADSLLPFDPSALPAARSN